MPATLREARAWGGSGWCESARGYRSLGLNLVRQLLAESRDQLLSDFIAHVPVLPDE